MSSSSSILYMAAKETLVEYAQKTSLNGFGLLYYIRRRKYQRILWFMFIAMGVLCSIYVCLATLVSFLSEPTITVFDTQQHPIWNIHFPSVAVCSNNKLSRKAVREYARNMSTFTSDSWLQKLELFAGFFNTDSLDFGEAEKLQNQLNAIYRQSFNTREVLKTLSPKCQDLVLKCFWADRMVNCEDELKLIAFEEGYCCVYNYQYERLKSQDLLYPGGIGREYGLALLLNSSTNDYFYTEGSSNGFRVQIFGSQRIPSTSTGDVAEFHVDAGDDIDIMLNLVSQTATYQTRQYSVQKRGCYFPSEHKEAGHGLSTCLQNCRLRNIQLLCHCIPFYAHEGHPNASTDQCNLAHSECLERYRVTWKTFRPTSANIDDQLQAELLDSISCPECLSLCTFNSYEYRKAGYKLSQTQKNPDNSKYLVSFPNLSSDLSLVKVYFPSKYGVRYKKKVLFNWYQILSNIGGVIGICMGCSIISGFEILYFGIVRLFENYIKCKANMRR